MAEVFVSYSNKDRALAEMLARDIEAAGWSVWWDPEIRAGENYRDVILRELDAAKAVIVIWTKHSVKSEWVISEAARAMRKPRDRYVALREDGLDQHDIPPPFDVRHAVRVEAWEAIRGALQGYFGMSASKSKGSFPSRHLKAPLEASQIIHTQLSVSKPSVVNSRSAQPSAQGSPEIAGWHRLNQILKFLEEGPDSAQVLEAIEEAESLMWQLPTRGMDQVFLEACAAEFTRLRDCIARRETRVQLKLW